MYLFQQKHKDFVVDVVKDFSNILFSTSHDDKKGIISLGGSISKHHAIQVVIFLNLLKIQKLPFTLSLCLTKRSEKTPEE